MDNWESRGKRADEERELYRGIFYEPPYSIWQAAVGLIVLAIGRLLYRWIWGDSAPRRRPLEDRRVFLRTLAGGLLAAPLAAEAQQAAQKVYRVGVLHPARCLWDPNAPLPKALDAAGYRLGQNVAFECKEANGDAAEFPRLATALVASKVDIIFAIDTAAAKAARDATRRIPIVFVALDAVAEGLVPSLGRPGGNLTGISILGREVTEKTLELLKQVVPGVRRVAIVADPLFDRLYRRWAQEIGGAAGVEFRMLIISGPDDYEHVFQEASRWGAGAVWFPPTADNTFFRSRIASLAMSSRLPTMGSREFVEAGGLMSYGSDVGEFIRLAVTYVDKILKGAKPADLPVEQPTKFELVINLKTAKALGLTIPPSLLLRADQVIE